MSFERLTRSASPVEFRDRLRKTLIDSQQLTSSGKLFPDQRGLNGSGVAPEDKRKPVKLPKIIDNTKREGAMVALMLSKADADQLAIDGGNSAESLHITLAFLGKTEDLSEDVYESIGDAVAKAISHISKIEGRVSGVGRFDASVFSEGYDTIYASFDSPQLNTLREFVVAELDSAGVTLDKSHGFSPHITLAYVEAGSPSPVDSVKNIELTFDSVSVVMNDAVDETFDLVDKKRHRKKPRIIAAPEHKNEAHKFMGDNSDSCELCGRDETPSSICNCPDADETVVELARHPLCPPGEKYVGGRCVRKAVILEEVQKPFPNEHAARQVDPTGFVRFRRVNNPRGVPAGISFIFGIRSDNKSEIQSIRFDRSKFTVAEARTWLKDHDFKSNIEAATVKSKTEKGDKRYESEIFVPILKKDEDRRLVTGIVLEPDEVDAQNDTISMGVIEEAAHNFLAKFNRSTQMGIMHKMFGEIGVELVESFIVRETTKVNGHKVKKGSWMITIKVLDDLVWKKVKSGEITGFSIGGVATLV